MILAVFGRDRATVATLILGGLLMIAIRLHVWSDDFPNPDIAGIVYNAEGLLRGQLPYVATIEIKPPGAFVLAAVSLSVDRSLELLQLWHLLWLSLGGLGVWWAAASVAADESDPVVISRCAAVATAVYLVTVAMFSYNYSSWMTPASALAVGATLRGLRRGGLGWSMLAGAMAVLAVLTIQRAAVLAIVMVGCWVWARRRQWSGATVRAGLGWGAGGALTMLPLVTLYASGGEVGALLTGIVPWDAATDYAARAEGSLLGNAARGVLQVGTVNWFAVGLVAVAALGSVRSTPPRTATDRSAWTPGVLWLLASFVGVSLGQRYYLHYAVQYAPALALLVGHPAWIRRLSGLTAQDRDGARDRGPHRRVALLAAAAALLALGLIVEVGLGRGQRYEAMARRLQDGRTAAQAAGRHIREHTDGDATIQAWGWTAWRVYYWADRRCATRVYKPMGTVTTFNTNTEFDSSDTLTFRDGPAAREMIEAWDRGPPAYFVYSPSLVQAFGAKREPLDDFAPLRDRLAADYVPEAAFGDLRILRRRAGI
jgi:hypothetical protein